MPPPRPHALARAPLVDRLNGLLSRAWEKGRLAKPTLELAELIGKGTKNVSPQDEFGGRSARDAADFRLRLDRLSASVRAEADLNPVGIAIAHGQLTRVIRQRWALGRLWRERPELAETELAPPIIIVGQMRSGTTRIHRLLAADPAFAATRFCDSWHPVPSKMRGKFDLRPMRGGMALFMARKLDPWIDSLHPMGASRHDEELGWLASALGASTYEAQWHIPAYTAFSEARDPAPLYREFARILRTDAAHHGNAHLPRVMKVPQFSEELCSLLAEFPDARLVVARRDDGEVARSAASLVANQMAIQSDSANLERIEAEWRRKIALRHERTEAALANFKGPVAELDFDRLGADWKGEVRALYAALNLTLPSRTVAAMEAEQARAGKSAHHGHSAQMAAFDKSA